MQPKKTYCLGIREILNRKQNAYNLQLYERETKFYLRRVTVILIITCDTKKERRQIPEVEWCENIPSHFFFVG